MANTAVTISKTKVSIFPIPSRISDFTHKFHIDYTDVNTGAGSTDTVTMTLGTTPTNWVISQCFVQVTTAFAGSGTFTIQAGISTATTAGLAAVTLGALGTLMNTGGLGSVNTASSLLGTAAATLTTVFTNSVSGSPSALSAGACDIYLTIIDPTKLDVSVTA